MKRKNKKLILQITTVVSSILLFLLAGLVLRFLDFSETEADAYGISYVGSLDGTVVDIPSVMYSSKGSYPTTYYSGYETKISDLLGKMDPVEWDGWKGAYSGSPVEVGNNKTFSFYGWYWDKACTMEFNGTVSQESVGDIKLYAKLTVDYWSPNY